MFEGCGTALVTPFQPGGALDEKTLRALVRRQIDAGINFLAPCGTTGESPTLTRAEHLRVVEITVEEAKGKCRCSPARAATTPPRSFIWRRS
jgi:4-hydroxy-tetrahydrodipicolinate synthase